MKWGEKGGDYDLPCLRLIAAQRRKFTGRLSLWKRLTILAGPLVAARKCVGFDRYRIRRRSIPATESSPVPNSASVPGSGIG
jgi:hypothetical protein